MVSANNIHWATPSKDASGSMPIGNGDLGANVWVDEKSGDLMLLVSKTDAWDENGRLLKLGKLRVHCGRSLAHTTFMQELQLEQGQIRIKSGPPGDRVDIRIWCDANQPALRVLINSDQYINIAVHTELWRTSPRVVPEQELSGWYGLIKSPLPIIEDPDIVMPAADNRIGWYHRNERSLYPDTLRLQGLESLLSDSEDPLLHRTTGAIVFGSGLFADGNSILRSDNPVGASAERSVSHAERSVSHAERSVSHAERSVSHAERSVSYAISLYAHTAQTSSADQWVSQIHEVADADNALDLQSSLQHTAAWWHNFWQQSYIELPDTHDTEAATVASGYVLQRYMHACSGRGAYPIKFNGSIFTFDGELHHEDGRVERFNADYRRWGSHYWFQNTRLLYWSMLASGDYELMLPFFNMYRNALPLAQARERLYHGHGGAFFPETMSFWGTYANDNYGWDREGLSASVVVNPYIRYYWQGVIELIAMMLVYMDHCNDARFMREVCLPLATEILAFFNQHFSRDDAGVLRIEPASALETWHEAINPTPEIAGLHYVLPKLLQHASLVDAAVAEEWRELLAHLPDVPVMREAVSGEPILAPAEHVFGPIMNHENPELYAIFPYPLYVVGSSGEATGRRSYHARRMQRTGCWHQDAIQAAYLGLPEESWRDIHTNFSSHYGRFPACWGPSFDWMPDQDHGSVAMLALQSMLLQSRGGKIYIFPAWDTNRNVRFKLHAEQGTVVEAACMNGEIALISVQPAERAVDVVICP